MNSRFLKICTQCKGTLGESIFPDSVEYGSCDLCNLVPTSGHYITQCNKCLTVIEQCRCPGPKTITWTTCKKCREQPKTLCPICKIHTTDPVICDRCTPKVIKGYDDYLSIVPDLIEKLKTHLNPNALCHKDIFEIIRTLEHSIFELRIATFLTSSEKDSAAKRLFGGTINEVTLKYLKQLASISQDSRLENLIKYYED